MTNKVSNYYQHSRPEMIKFIPANCSKILEIGCSSGYFGNLVKKNISCFYEGIEPHYESAKIASQNIDKVYNVTIEEFFNDNKQTHQYDAIIFNDVLEHLIDPWEVISSCKKLLTDEGVIVASIPNIRHFNVIWNLLKNKDFEYKDAGVLDKTHLRFFTLNSMKKMFRDSGFEILNCTGINASYGRKYKLFNIFLFNKIWDMKYIQFAIVAKKTFTA